MIDEVTNTLNQRCQIRERKQSLQSLAHVHDSIEKLSNILVKKSTANSKDEEQTKLDSDLLERAATEFNQLKFHISRCKRDLAEARIEVLLEIKNFIQSLILSNLSHINEVTTFFRRATKSARV